MQDDNHEKPKKASPLSREKGAAGSETGKSVTPNNKSQLNSPILRKKNATPTERSTKNEQKQTQKRPADGAPLDIHNKRQASSGQNGQLHKPLSVGLSTRRSEGLNPVLAQLTDQGGEVVNQNRIKKEQQAATQQQSATTTPVSLEVIQPPVDIIGKKTGTIANKRRRKGLDKVFEEMEKSVRVAKAQAQLGNLNVQWSSDHQHCTVSRIKGDPYGKKDAVTTELFTAELNENGTTYHPSCDEGTKAVMETIRASTTLQDFTNDPNKKIEISIDGPDENDRYEAIRTLIEDGDFSRITLTEDSWNNFPNHQNEIAQLKSNYENEHNVDASYESTNRGPGM